MGRSSAERASGFPGLQSADDSFTRRDEFIYGNSGVVEHRVTFTARPPAPEKPPSHAPPRRCNHHTTMSTRKTISQRTERRLHPRQVEMRTKLLVGSALLLWLFTRPRYSHWYPRPFGWGLS